MEELVQRRCAALSIAPTHDWIIGLRLKETVPLPRLNRPNCHVVDFFDCCANPHHVKSLKHNRLAVAGLAFRIYKHWQWLHEHPKLAQLQQAAICSTFVLPKGAQGAADAFPHSGGVL